MKYLLLLLSVLCPSVVYAQTPKLDMFGPLDPPKPVVKPINTQRQSIGVNHWNIEGDWNASDAKIAQHLRDTHGINPTGMTREQMLSVHDHAHEKSRPVQYYSTGGCPGGVCPTTRMRRR